MGSVPRCESAPPPEGTPRPPEEVYLRDTVRTAVTLLIVGHDAAGTSAFVRTMSEIPPLRTEDGPAPSGTATAGTATTDFGRLTLNDRTVLYLFGAAGQDRLTGLWQDLRTGTPGALGALVLIDTARPERSSGIIGLLERLDVPFAVALDRPAGTAAVPEAKVREAMDLPPGTPLVTCDARDHASSARALIALVDHLLRRTDQETS